MANDIKTPQDFMERAQFGTRAEYRFDCSLVFLATSFFIFGFMVGLSFA